MSEDRREQKPCGLCNIAGDLLFACRMLQRAWDAGEESQDVDWEDLCVAVELASAAIEKVDNTGGPDVPPSHRGYGHA